MRTRRLFSTSTGGFPFHIDVLLNAQGISTKHTPNHPSLSRHCIPLEFVLVFDSDSPIACSPQLCNEIFRQSRSCEMATIAAGNSSKALSKESAVSLSRFSVTSSANEHGGLLHFLRKTRGLANDALVDPQTRLGWVPG